MEYDSAIFHFHDSIPVAVIASFSTTKKIKPLYVRINNESVQILKSRQIETAFNMIVFECSVADGDRERIIQLLYHKDELKWQLRFLK